MFDPRPHVVAKVEAAIREKGTSPFSAHEIAAQCGLRCRQTVYQAIRVLNEQGHRIEGERKLGFMARLKPSAAPCESI